MSVVTERLDTHNLAFAVGLAREMHGLSTFGMDGPVFDWEFCRSTMARTMQSPNHYFMLARNGDGYVGAVVGHVETHFFSPKIMGIEEAWFVRENTPNRAAVGMKLMRGFVDWCMNEKHALSVQSGDIASIQSLGVDALYRRMGFARLGVIYKFVRKV
jgi:ribosomal protein S18 acetylase RimI-like enzyme